MSINIRLFLFVRKENGGSDMNYSSGNYEAFARPRKPKDVDKKSAYLVGSGLAALSGLRLFLCATVR